MPNEAEPRSGWPEAPLGVVRGRRRCVRAGGAVINDSWNYAQYPFQVQKPEKQPEQLSAGSHQAGPLCRGVADHPR